MRYLTLGKTGLQVSEVGFGGIPIIRLSVEEAVAVLRRALARGVTLFDTANLYMDSEEKIGRALKGERSRVVLATKSIKRDRAGVEADIHQSLQKLRTNYLDLFQFHQVSQEADLEALTGPRGAMEGVVRARGGSRPPGAGSGDSEILPATAGETTVSDRFSQCQTFFEIASGYGPFVASPYSIYLNI